MSFKGVKNGYRHTYELITSIALKNIKLRYKNSMLGFLWGLLNPLLFLLIFSIVFSSAFPNMENYPLYALTGIIFWTYFNSTTNQVTNSIIESAGVLKSINIPTIVFPASSLYSSIINMFLTFIPFSVLMVYFGYRPGIELLLIIPIIISFSVFIFGISLFLCAFNVFFRDVSMLWTGLMPALFYSTPIAYPIEIIPAKFALIIKLNPLYHYIKMARDVLYDNSVPDLQTVLITTALSVVTIVIGTIAFKKLEPGFISNY